MSFHRSMFTLVLCFMTILSAEAVKVGKRQGGVGLLSDSASKTNVHQNAKAATSADLMKNLADDDVFVQIGDDDKVTWGMLHNYIDSALNMKIAQFLSAMPSADDQMGGIRVGLYQQAISKTLRKYIGAAVIAYDAKQKGMTVPTVEFDKQLAEIKKKSPNPTPFQYQFLTNAVYQNVYAEKFIKPSIKIPEAAVTNLITKRHNANLSVPATNAIFKARIVDLRNKISDGKANFGEIAEEWSDCTDCCSNGGDCGTWEEDDSGIDPELLKVCFSIPTNTLSQVVETPEAFHVIKVVSKYIPTKKARDEDGEVSSVDVMHLQIDKWTPEPEFTKKTAREFIEQRMLASALMIRQQKLIDTVPIKSVIRLKANAEESKRAATIRRILDKARRGGE